MIGLAGLWMVCVAWLTPPAPAAAQSLPSAASTSTVQGPPDEAPADGRGDASILREPCEDALDRIVADYRPPRAEATRTRLLRLQSQCPELAHIEHNLAYLAGAQGDWSQAEAHLLAALRLDRRANQSFAQLQAIREFQAALAWRDVLDDEPSLPAPTLSLQDASVYNGTQPHLSWPRDDAGQATAVEYDVYAWWQATEFEEQAQWARHFVDGQPIPSQPPSRPVPWEQVHRRVHFNKHEAIVVLRYEQAGEHVRQLLFMSLRGNRWRIFREWSTRA